MVDIRKDETIHNHFEFKSPLQIPIHFLCSTVQLIFIFAILALQTTLTITKTCAFGIGVGFWCFPFLIMAPISVWIFVCKRNLLSCFIVIIIQIGSNLFATTIIIISILVLIEQIGISCSTSNTYSLPLNVSLIGVSAVLKIFLYGEIILLYMVGHDNQKVSILLTKNYEIIFDNPKKQTLQLLKVDPYRFDDMNV